MPPERASQTLTFLFTDIEGSTRLWEQHQDSMKDALERHDAILRTAIEGSNGQVVKNIGDGFMAVFGSAIDGVNASLRAQHGLAGEPWGQTGPLRVRMGLHAGEAATREGDYYGPTLNRTARIMSAGHGGQVLLSAAAAALVVDHLPDGSSLRDLGEYPLKGLGRAERVFQLTHPDLPEEFPPLVTPARRLVKLPEQPSAFVGRDAELNEIGERLADDSVRLLTLTGPGGIGKTRLALRAAADAADGFEDGVFFVDLSAATDTEAVLASIADSLDVAETGEKPLLDELNDRLRGQHALLVLDNFEQVSVAAPTVAKLIQSSPRLKLLVTSREALHVGGEHLFAVPVLSLPAAVAKETSAEQLAQYEAIRLFVARAQAVRPEFRLTDENAAAVAEICLRLDGLPLALELATARLNLFTPETLRDRLGSSLQLLRSGARDAPARHQTLRATIEWSFQLLESAEQRLFELLSTFSGATFEAVEAVAASAGTDVDALDGLTSLMDKSLIRRAGPATGDQRFEMLETVREYAAERLDADAELSAAARRAHASYYAALAGGRDDIAADLQNLRLAWRYWLAERDLDQLDMLLEPLWQAYESRGSYQAMLELTTEMLDVLSSTPERALQELTLQTARARALMVVHGFTHEVEDAYTRALEATEGEQLPQLFPVLRGLATFHTYRAEFAKAERLGREILRLAEVQDDVSMRVDGHMVHGSSVSFLGDFHGGVAEMDEAIALAESQPAPARRFRLGNDSAVAALTTTGINLWMLGFPDRARERGQRAVARATALEHPFTLAFALYHTGLIHMWRREPELVRDRAVSVLDVADEYDLEVWRALGAVLLGVARTGLGRLEEGVAELDEGLARYQTLRTPPVFWPLLLYMRAGAAGRAGKPDEGLRFLEPAIEIVGEQASLLPLLLLLKGELLIAAGRAPDGAVTLRQAFDRAAQLDARMFQLRAAISLCRCEADGGRELLSATHATFTEGFDLPDLIEAKDLLET